MKRRSYSTYDAKARFSEILRKVRDGESVYISYRGRDVAEILPLKREKTDEERLLLLEDRGVVSQGESPTSELAPIVTSIGALARFLESRD